MSADREVGGRRSGEDELAASKLNAISRAWRIGLAGVAATAVLCGLALAQSGDELEDGPIRYSKTPATDAVARLQKLIDQGKVTLKRDPVKGYLPSVLKALNIPASSQTLVFSKTSFQRDLISPSSPRALYFNDDVYVGWVQGSQVIEISSADPRLGGVFYTLDISSPKPRFVRETYDCLQCHTSSMTRGVPGHMIRSVFTRIDGQPQLQAGSYLTTDESPMVQRFGGWYVTGTHGTMRHMGNLLIRSAAEADDPDLSGGANLSKLNRFVDTRAYLTPHSDLVALLVMQHQTHVHNLITKVGYETRRALEYEKALAKDLGVAEGQHLESTLSRVRSVTDALVKAMLFTRAAPLTAPVRGTSTFAVDFQRPGPRDAKGRSLRELDLSHRLFRYPCSYLIYTEAFDALPLLAREQIYRQLRNVLSAENAALEFAHLTPSDRQALREILTETKPEFASLGK